MQPEAAGPQGCGPEKFLDDEVLDFYAEVTGLGRPSLDGLGGAPGSRDEAPRWVRGEPLGLPPQWVLVVCVDDLGSSIAACHRLGGEVVQRPLRRDGDRLCVLRDPSGAVFALRSSPGSRPAAGV